MLKNNRINIVVIDDNEMTRAILRRIFHTDDRYEVIGEATNGNNALELITKLRPHIICLDITMPGMSGLDILQQVKEQYPEIIVLMVTSSNDKATVQTAIERGASGFVVKPFTAGNVLKIMDNLAAKIQA